MYECGVDDKRKSFSFSRFDQRKGCASIIFPEVIRLDPAFALQQLLGFRQSHYQTSGCKRICLQTGWGNNRDLTLSG